MILYTLNNIGSSKRTFQYYYYATITQELHGNSTEWFLPNNLYCLECKVKNQGQ